MLETRGRGLECLRGSDRRSRTRPARRRFRRCRGRRLRGRRCLERQLILRFWLPRPAFLSREYFGHPRSLARRRRRRWWWRWPGSGVLRKFERWRSPRRSGGLGCRGLDGVRGVFRVWSYWFAFVRMLTHGGSVGAVEEQKTAG